jgi:hypothetical protein
MFHQFASEFRSSAWVAPIFAVAVSTRRDRVRRFAFPILDKQKSLDLAIYSIWESLMPRRVREYGCIA